MVPNGLFSYLIFNSDDHDHHSFALSLRSVSLIKHATPPTRVLDIGCGTGAWVFSASNEWPNARFVGLDVAQAFPDLGAVSELLSDEKSTRGKRLSFSTSRRMSKEWKGRVNAKPSGKHDRIQFVEADFLQGLPFRDEEFDYVHVKGIAVSKLRIKKKIVSKRRRFLCLPDPFL